MPVLEFDYQVDGCYILSTSCVGGSSQHRGRVAGKIASGQGVLKAGTVLGLVTATGEYFAHDPALADGAEIATGVLFGSVDTGTNPADPAVDSPVDKGEIEANDQFLIFKTGISNGDKMTAIQKLGEVGIIVRAGMDHGYTPDP